jgi:hypothetical protein
MVHAHAIGRQPPGPGPRRWLVHSRRALRAPFGYNMHVHKPHTRACCPWAVESPRLYTTTVALALRPSQLVLRSATRTWQPSQRRSHKTTAPKRAAAQAQQAGAGTQPPPARAALAKSKDAGKCGAQAVAHSVSLVSMKQPPCFSALSGDGCGKAHARRAHTWWENSGACTAARRRVPLSPKQA